MFSPIQSIATSNFKSATSNGTHCHEQLGGLPRAIGCRASKLILPAELPFIPYRSHGRTRWRSLRNGQSAVRSLSVDQLLKAVHIRGSGLLNQLSQAFVGDTALTNVVAEVRLDIAQRTDRNLRSLHQYVLPESLGNKLQIRQESTTQPRMHRLKFQPRTLPQCFVQPTLPRRRFAAAAAAFFFRSGSFFFFSLNFFYPFLFYSLLETHLQHAHYQQIAKAYFRRFLHCFFRLFLFFVQQKTMNLCC